MSNSNLRKMDIFVNMLLVYLLLFVGGTWLSQLSFEKSVVASLAISLLAWGFFSDRTICIRFIFYVIVFACFQIIINLYTDGSLTLTSIIGTVSQLLLAYFIIKKVGLDFSSTYVNVVVIIAIFSLIGYLSDTLYLFDWIINKLPKVGEVGYEGMLYVYRFQAHIDRNNSIFYEPSVYQYFLNIGLYLLLFANTHISNIRRWVYIIILLVALITAFSTTGFLIFAAILGMSLFEGRRFSAASKVMLLGSLFLLMALFSKQFSYVIFEKIDKTLSVQSATDISDRRGTDVLVDIEIFKQHVFGAGHEKYREMFVSTGHVDSEYAGSSNGITKTLAVYGLPFSLFIFASYYWALRKLLGGGMRSLVTYGILIAYFISQSNFVFYPACMAIIAAAFIFDQPQSSVKQSFSIQK